MRKLICILLFISAVSIWGQKFEGLAKTPPMGWNSWNKFACDVDENLIKQAADEMVSSGMKDAGYEYIVIDDCWHGERDSLGFIHPDPKHFPSGMKALTDYIHSKGLKFGIYSDAGWTTCAGRPGSRGREYQDAMQYAKWGVDYLKYDWCDTEGLSAKGAYLTIRDALFEAGRPIVLSMCEWGNNKPWEWAKDIGHLWRTTGDIAVIFHGEKDHGTWSSWGVMNILDMQDGLREYAGPDHWNDPDMMEVGNGLTVSEDRAHFSMWCMLAAPLMAGNDLGAMTPETVAILTNKEAISIDQDSLGVQGFKYSDKDSIEVWFKPLVDENWAMCILNRNDDERKVSFDWAVEKVIDSFAKRNTDFDKIKYTYTNVWDSDNSGDTSSKLEATIPGHDVLMLKLIKK